MTYIVRVDDNCLSSAYAKGMSAQDLYRSFTSFGDDPYIVGPEDKPFSAWGYAKTRCTVLCGTDCGRV